MLPVWVLVPCFVKICESLIDLDFHGSFASLSEKSGNALTVTITLGRVTSRVTPRSSPFCMISNRTITGNLE